MAFSIFFALTVIINLTYAVSKKNLHLFEIFFIWMVLNIIHHNFMTIFALNALLCVYLFDKFDPKGKYITTYVVLVVTPLLKK